MYHHVIAYGNFEFLKQQITVLHTAHKFRNIYYSLGSSDSVETV